MTLPSSPAKLNVKEQMTPPSSTPKLSLLRKYLLKPVGFFEKQATMREFVILLTLLVGGYVALHLVIPSNSSLSFFKAKRDKVRSPILQEIGLMKDELKSKENVLLSQLNQAATSKVTTTQTATSKDSTTQTATPKDSTTQTATPKDSTTQILVSQTNSGSLLTSKTIGKWKDGLKNTNLSNKEERYLGDLSSLLDQLKQLEGRDIKGIKGDDMSILFLNINKSLINLEASLENSLEQNLFWTGNGKWLEVILWSLFGTLLYIIQQTAEYHLSSTEKKDVKDIKVLVRRKPQYYYFLFQSPFTALVILWILSMANLNIAGIALALSSVPSEVLISLAFILGLFNRVANTQLNMIVAGIFGDAWKKTVRKIEIQKCEDENEDQDNQRHPRKRNLSTRASIEVYCGDCTDFEVLPDVKVKWSIESKPSAGIIDISTGTYIAPPRGFYYEDSGLKPLKRDNENYHNYTQDIIKAVREDEPDVSALILVSLLDQAPVDQPLIMKEIL